MDKAIIYNITQYSVVLAEIIAILKFKKAATSFLPFFIFIWLGCVNEVVSSFTSLYLRNNAINNNIYVLAESLLLLWLFGRWRLFDANRKLPTILASVFVLVWVGEVFIFSSIWQVAGYFRVVYSFAIVLVSISMINKLITQESGNLLKNAAFIICIAFIFYFTFKILVEIFYLYGLMGASKEFRLRIFDIMRAINLFCNIVYAVALLWVPKKHSSLMSSL